MWRFIHRWHKRLGIVSALFVILLSISGILLNHTESLGMQNRFIQNKQLLDAYNIGPDENPYGFQVNDQWISRVGDRIYFNQHLITEQVSELTGAVWTDDVYVIAMDNEIVLVTGAGEVIEKLSSSEGVPTGMKEIGLSDSGHVIIRATRGDYYADFDNSDWQDVNEVEAAWSRKNTIPDPLVKKLLTQYRGTGLSVERIILDIHSGRIVGNWGIYLVDFMAVLFFILALSGTWMWFKQK